MLHSVIICHSNHCVVELTDLTAGWQGPSKLQCWEGGCLLLQGLKDPLEQS